MKHARFTWLLVIVILVALVLTAGCGRRQHVSFTYDFAISPPKGQVLKDVTVYLPFPEKDGEPMKEIYESLMRDFKEYRVREYPDSKVSLVNTEHGTMLKVYVSEIGRRGYGLEGRYGFEEAFSKEQVAPHFLLAPRSNTKSLPNSIAHVSDTYVYADFDGAEEIGLALKYDISILSPSPLPLDYVPEDGHTAHLGFDEPPREPAILVFYVKKKGWSKVHLADDGYDKESDSEE